jgi:hypothetical protein
MARSKPRVKKQPRPLSGHKFLERAVQKQHEIIGLTYEPGTVLPDGWYSQHSWTLAQRDQFRSWFIRTMVQRVGEPQARAEKAWAWWNLGYGWKETRE